MGVGGISETNAGLNLCYRLKRIALADEQIGSHSFGKYVLHLNF